MTQGCTLKRRNLVLRCMYEGIDMNITLSRDTKITLRGIWRPRLRGAYLAWSTTLNHVFCRVAIVRGLKVNTISIEGPPGWYEEQSHVWIYILISGELPSSGDWDDRMSWLFRGGPYNPVFWWVSSLGVRARPYTSRNVTALQDDSFHDTKSSG